MLKSTTEWLKGGLEWEFVIVSHAPVFRDSKKQFHSLMLNGIFLRADTNCHTLSNRPLDGFAKGFFVCRILAFCLI